MGVSSAARGLAPFRAVVSNSNHEQRGMEAGEKGKPLRVGLVLRRDLW